MTIGTMGAVADNTAGIPEGVYSKGDLFFCDEKALEQIGDYVEVVKTFPTKTKTVRKVKKIIEEVPEEKDAKKYPPKDTPDY